MTVKEEHLINFQSVRKITIKDNRKIPTGVKNELNSRLAAEWRYP